MILFAGCLLFFFSFSEMNQQEYLWLGRWPARRFGEERWRAIVVSSANNGVRSPKHGNVLERHAVLYPERGADHGPNPTQPNLNPIDATKGRWGISCYQSAWFLGDVKLCPLGLLTLQPFCTNGCNRYTAVVTAPAAFGGHVSRYKRRRVESVPFACPNGNVTHCCC